jgi:hypothetical protein
MTAAVMALAGAASAGQSGFGGWDFTIATGNGDSPWRASENPGSWQITQTGGGQGDQPVRFRVVGSIEVQNQFRATFDLDLEPDPFVSSFFTIQNLTGVLQPFSITTTLPSIPVGNPSSMNGSTVGTVGDGDGVLDQFGNGASIRTIAGAPYYQALVDGVGVRSLYPDAQFQFAPQGQVAGIAAQNFPNEAGPGVLANIGIRNRFELTPGDNASFTSTFFIIPAPSGVALLGLAGLAAARRRR